MRMLESFKKSIIISMVFSVVSSISALMPIFAVNDEGEKVLIYIASSLFWLGLFGEQFFIWRANKLRKKLEDSMNHRKTKGMPGVCSFLKTEFGFVTDVVFTASLIILIVLMVGDWGKDVVQFIMLFLIVLSFRLHCLANGKNYRYKIYLQKRREKS